MSETLPLGEFQTKFHGFGEQQPRSGGRIIILDPYETKCGKRHDEASSVVEQLYPIHMSRAGEMVYGEGLSAVGRI